MVTWLKIFKPNDSTKKLSQMVLSQVTGNPKNHQNSPRDQSVTIVQSLSPVEGEQSIQTITSLKLFNKFITTIRLQATKGKVLVRAIILYEVSSEVIIPGREFL